MKIVADNNQAYLIKDDQVVAAFEIEDIDAPEEEVIEPGLTVGSRVAYFDKLGTIVTQEVSQYGPFFGVKFDDGSLGEHEASELTANMVPAPNFDSPVAEIRNEWEEYQDLPSDTLTQIETKSSIARSLNLRAKALKTDKQTAFSDSILLDKIATTTEVDVLDLKTAHIALTANDEQANYLEELPSKLDYRSTKGSSDEDTDWVQDFDLGEEDLNTEAELTSTAMRITASCDKEQLEDEQFMNTVISNQAQHLGLDDEKKKYLEEAVKLASLDKLAEPVVRTVPEEKTIDLDTYDSTELFI
jgi:hypothetical protein